MKDTFDKVSIKCSKITTNAYSTSFSLGIYCLEKSLRDPIYSIYGFVRFADEIVDTFHDYNKASLLEKFKADTYDAIKEGISLNPILNSFQQTVNTFKVDHQLIDLFLKSMETDLSMQNHSEASLREYILGSAEAVGLMCLRVFCKENDDQYVKLKPYAMSLGAAFQKVNFLRDFKDDFMGLGRTYFPGIDFKQFNKESKKAIEESIDKDFEMALIGIKGLPRSARFGVYVAYIYYQALFKKIKNTPSEFVMYKRIRIPNRQKVSLLAYSYFKHQLNLI